MVALRERSMDIFGDEKYLDNMLGTKMFGVGRLTLELLRCYIPSVPIYSEAIEPGQVDRPLLVVEITRHFTHTPVGTSAASIMLL